MTSDADSLVEQAAELLAACRSRDLTIATGESCTGGLIAAVLTEVAGSSDVFDRGFVTYSNAAKIRQLGVAERIIKEHGAVSREAAVEMAKGVLEVSDATLAVAVTGIAGPGGGTPGKPVGLVYLAAIRRGGMPVVMEANYGEIGRRAVRLSTVRDALGLLRRLV